MYPRLKDFFYFNKVERNGIILLLVILISLIGVNIWLSNQEQEFSQNSKEVEKGLAFLDSIYQIETNIKQKSKIKEEKKVKLTPIDFNPNTTSLEDFKQIGLTEKQAQTIIKYRTKGGVFRIKSDFKKMYSITDLMYEELKTHILLPDTFELPKRNFEKRNMPPVWTPPIVYHQ